MTKKHLKHTSIVRNMCERHVVRVVKVRSRRHRISAVCCQQASTTSVFRKLWRSQGIMAWYGMILTEYTEYTIKSVDTVLCHLIVFTSIKSAFQNLPVQAPLLHWTIPGNLPPTKRWYLGIIFTPWPHLGSSYMFKALYKFCHHHHHHHHHQLQQEQQEYRNVLNNIKQSSNKKGKTL